MTREISSDKAGAGLSPVTRPDSPDYRCTRLRQAMPLFLNTLSTIVLLLIICLPLPVPAAGIPSATESGQAPNSPRYYIKISIKGELLTLYERGDADRLVKLREYPVGTVVRGLKTYPTGIGKVTAISFNPWWYPTAYSRSVFRDRDIELPKAVPPGHPLKLHGALQNLTLSQNEKRGHLPYPRQQ